MKQILILTFFVLMLGYTTHAADQKSLPTEVLMETSMGNIRISLNKEKAPKTVENFLAYTRSGHYNGTIFHRVIKGFMIQGGGLTEDMRPKKTLAPIVNEADNQLKNTIGTIAMARTMNPHSATSQFFINVKANPFLDHVEKTQQKWGYCVFGKVVEGMDVVRAIENVQTTTRGGHRDVPGNPIIIKKVSFVQPLPSDPK
jgi:peptidyl-prolyl cis-trans isomerase B (cyclophilin B)